jgi:hypothetical protein
MLVTPAQSGEGAAFGTKQGKVLPLRKNRRGYPKKMYRSKKKGNPPLPVCCNFQEPVFSGMERLPLDFLPSADQCKTHFTEYDGGLSSDLVKVFGRAGDTNSHSCFAKTVVINPSEYGFGSMMHSLVKPAWKAAAEKFSIEFNKLGVW